MAYDGMKRMREAFLQGAEGVSQIQVKLSGKRIIFGPTSGELWRRRGKSFRQRDRGSRYKLFLLFYT